MEVEEVGSCGTNVPVPHKEDTRTFVRQPSVGHSFFLLLFSFPSLSLAWTIENRNRKKSPRQGGRERKLRRRNTSRNSNMTNSFSFPSGAIEIRLQNTWRPKEEAVGRPVLSPPRNTSAHSPWKGHIVRGFLGVKKEQVPTAHHRLPRKGTVSRW